MIRSVCLVPAALALLLPLAGPVAAAVPETVPVPAAPIPPAVSADDMKIAGAALFPGAGLFLPFVVLPSKPSPSAPSIVHAFTRHFGNVTWEPD